MDEERVSLLRDFLAVLRCLACWLLYFVFGLLMSLCLIGTFTDSLWYSLGVAPAFLCAGAAATFGLRTP